MEDSGLKPDGETADAGLRNYGLEDAALSLMRRLQMRACGATGWKMSGKSPMGKLRGDDESIMRRNQECN